MSQRPALSVVVPMFNEQDILPAFYDRATAVLKSIGPYELIFVDDGSRDRTLEILTGLQSSDPSVRVLEFSRNFGHQNAITAGLDHASGEACVIMDGDLQDPPEIIADMVKKWREGYEVVYAVRRSREGETAFKLWTAHLFYRGMRALSGVNMPLDAGDFRLMDRRVLDALARMPERNRFLRGLVSWAGYRQIGVSFDRPPRAVGETKFSLWKMARFALNGVTSFSHLPLRLVTLVGFLCFALSLALLGWVFYAKFFSRSIVQGWTSLIGVILFLGGVQLLALGVIGEYIAQIFDEAKHRPHYLIRRAWGFPDKAQK